MTDLENSIDKKRLSCPICNSTFFNIFPSGQCQKCFQLVCGHCIQHDNPEHENSICRDCIEKLTPYGQLAEMDLNQLVIVLQDASSKQSPIVPRLLADRKDQDAVSHLCKALESNRINDAHKKIIQHPFFAVNNLFSTIHLLLVEMHNPAP